MLQAFLAAGLLAELAKLSIPWNDAARATFEKVADDVSRSSGVKIDPDVLHAIAWQESGVQQFKADGSVIRGAAGEYGMMQVMPVNASGEDLTTMLGNVRAAAKLWAANARAIGPLVADGFAAYNGGVNRVQRQRQTGKYGNDNYVFEASARYWAIKGASLAPSAIARRLV
ncbi:MAG TPA: transglycosylase SLT domain-containing protein [Thermoanaerobaculia bacterium]|jgi:soluble lytic murein transglycosylase-like protein